MTIAENLNFDTLYYSLFNAEKKIHVEIYLEISRETIPLYSGDCRKPMGYSKAYWIIKKYNGHLRGRVKPSSFVFSFFSLYF